MPEFQKAGVVISNVQYGPRPIRAAPTSVAGFVGIAADGPFSPRRVAGLKEFERLYGPPSTGAHLHGAVRHFFLNGGRSAWVARVRDGSVAAVAGEDNTDPEQSTGLAAFRHLPDIALVAAPGFHDGEVHAALSRHAATAGNRMAILDGPPGAGNPEELAPAVASDSAAIFHPWLTEGATASPPSGAVCGIMARTDASHGVWSAPAGTNAVLRGVDGVAADFTEGQQGMLKGQRVNLIRHVAGTGTVMEGGRTLSADPEWKYISVRRTALFLETSLSRGLQWTVFEPNGPPLWAEIKHIARTFLDGLFREGAFAGRSAADAWFVRCGLGATMTETDIERGIVNIAVGFAPLKPAEFVVFRIGQITADARS